MLSALHNLPSDVETPALVVDEKALLQNVADMATMARSVGVQLRPHVKTHKCVEIARAQTSAGAIGLSCATVSELVEFAKAGFSDLLLTSPVADRPKLERLAQVTKSSRISFVVDHADQIRAISELLKNEAIKPQVLIDIDVGQCRTGVIEVSHALELANEISAARSLEFAGIQGFAGQVQHIADPGERAKSAGVAADSLKYYASALRGAGHPVKIVTGSGTGAAEFDGNGPYTELQVGSYIFMDADYRAIRRRDGGALPYQPSLFVLATVTSLNRRNEFTIDAGVKALAFNGPPPSQILGAPIGSTYRFAGDEHGIVTMPEGSAPPRLGSRVCVLTTHCDPTVNLHPRYTVLKTDGNVGTWPTVARYAF